MSENVNGLRADLHDPDCAGMDADGNWLGPCLCAARPIIDELRQVNAYTLANDADTYTPDSLTSAGSEFLYRVRDALLESVEFSPEVLADDEGNAHEVADSAVPIYTHPLWATFVDLGAYREDVSELAGDTGSVDMESLARIALYMIAERLASSLRNQIREALDIV